MKFDSPVAKVPNKQSEVENNELKSIYISLYIKEKLIDSFLALIHFLRESLLELTFEIYVLSVNQACHRKKFLFIFLRYTFLLEIH